MLREEEKDQTSGGSWTYSRSMSWTERPPRKSNPKPQWNSKARACLPPLQPLSIVRPSFEEWPRAGSDDLGIWPNPPTPGARPRSITPRENATSDQPPREFESGKDKLAFFDKECSRILDHIYLGSDAIAKNREILRQNGITHVLNCVGFVCPEYFKNELVYRTLWLQDCPSEDITSILYDVFDYFEDVREQGGRVLVHCCHGVSRSTSLVIAYLMWKEGQSFDDAFQRVRTARGVTNPNVGFACQLLQCQKRVHALPASPTSVLRMYRMAPHSPYDPLHLVPKMLCEPGADKLDSRGAFIIHISCALYVWIGKYCSSVMSDNAMAAASQVIRYEKAQGPVIIVKEGEETIEFQDAFACGKCLADSGHVSSEEEKRSSGGSNTGSTVSPCIDQKKLNEYDLDFEIFHRALAGGIVPPLPLSEAGSVTHLPARENGWNRLSIKSARVTMEEFITSTKLESTALQTVGTCRELECTVSSADLSIPSSSPCDSPDSFASFVTSSPGWIENNSKEVEFPAPLSDTSLSYSSSSNLVDSFSSFSVSKPKSKSTSPSPAISPSTSDYSSSFSPSSSNWSDLSFVSAQPSLYRFESRDVDPGKSDPTEENVGFVDNSTCLLDDVTSPTREEAISARHIPREAGLCSTSGEISCSLVECRGSRRPPRMIFPSIDEASQISENLMRYLEDHAIDVESDKFNRKVCFGMDGEEPISDANGHAAAAEVLSRLWDGKKYDTFHLTADDMTNKVAEASNLVFYKWPSIHKMDMHFGILASRSVYIILIPALSFGTKIANALYVWIGRNESSKGSHVQLIRNNSNYEDNHARVETIGRNLLHEEGFSQIKDSEGRKDGITLHCPHVKEPPSLWENPYSATTSWKPCAERREGIISDLPAENETNGYIFIHAEGGLNQQRIAICNAVAVAKIMNATLILPVLKQDQIWKDQTKFEDIFDVDHFIDYLKNDVRIVRDIPEWFTDKAELFTSIRRTVKNIPKYAPAQFYIDNVLPRIKEKRIMALKPFVDRLGYDNVPQEINRLRCRVNYHALKFLPEIENMADLLVSRMRNRTGSSNPFMALHLRFEKGMVGLSFCDFVGTRMEKALMALYRLKEWPRRFKDGSHLWALALQKRKEGRCPLEPGEVAVMLRAMGYPKETQIYVASGQVYGGQNRMAPLRNMFPNLVTKEELATKLELDGFRKHVTSLAALDFLVCLKSDVFVMTHGGNFAKLIIGNRRYLGHHLKSIKPDKGLMSKSLGDPYMGWATFVEDVIVTHQTRTGLPEETFPNYDIWENPLTPCMCRT